MMRWALVIALICAVGAGAQTKPLVIRDVDVFDGYRLLRHRTVTVSGGMIRGVDAGGGPTLLDADVIEGRGKTLLPGLIDGHVHISHVESLEQAAALGVTTVLDMFNFPDQLLPLREQLKEGKLPDAADFRSALIGVTVPKGAPGGMGGPPFPTLQPKEDIQAFVDARIAAGSDYVKIFDEHKLPTLTEEQLRGVIAAAHKRNKLTAVHIGGEAEALQAILAGADCIEHIFDEALPTSELVKAAAENHVSFTPTLSVLEGVSGSSAGPALAKDPHFSPYLVGWNIEILNSKFPARLAETHHLSNAEAAVKALYQAGVTMLAGTDSPNPGTAYGASLHNELRLLVESGLSPQEALQAATVLPAQQFGLLDRGRIKPGRRADLVLVEGDPVEDITATRNIVAVWKEGHRVDREAMAKRAAASRQK